MIMTSGHDIVEYITDGKLEQVQRGMHRWIERCPRILEFLDAYKDKVRKKFRTTAPDGSVTEDLKDVCFELEVTYLLLCDGRFQVEYEKFGDGPDYTVAFENDCVFNVEVKRIREAALNKRLSDWRDYLLDRVKQIPSPFGFSLNHRTLNVDPQLVERLENESEAILDFVRVTITSQIEKLVVDDLIEIRVLGFESDLSFTLSRPKGKQDHTYTSTSSGLWPLYYKNEIEKFMDTICEKLVQLGQGMPNVLVVNSDSSTHDAHHLQAAVERLQTRIDLHDDDFFREHKHGTVEDFTEKAARLTGIVFRGVFIGETKDRNFLWTNGSAPHPIPEEVCRYFRQMGG